MRKISPSPGFDPGTVQTVASRHTDYAIPAYIDSYCKIKYCFLANAYKHGNNVVMARGARIPATRSPGIQFIRWQRITVDPVRGTGFTSLLWLPVLLAGW